MYKNLITLSIITVALVINLGCKGKSESDPSTEQIKSMAKTQRFGTGVISGNVLYTGPIPEIKKPNYSTSPDCQTANQGKAAVRSLETQDGKWAKAFVYIKSGLPKGYKVPQEPVVLDQQGCEYWPRVVGVQVGQNLRLLNSDPLLHNVHAKPDIAKGFNLAMPFKGMKIDRTFDKPEVMVDMNCDVHGWMRAYVGVVPHPFFQVTGSDGSYRFEKVPAGSYVVEVWHETLGRISHTLTLEDAASQQRDFSFQPSPNE